MDSKHTKYPKQVVDSTSFILVGVQKNIKQKEEMDPQTGQMVRHLKNILDHKHSIKFQIVSIQIELINPHNWEEISYKMLLGEVVSKVDELPDGLVSTTIPDHRFCKMIGGPGQIPDIVIEAWQSIGQISQEEMGGERSHDYDFEIYPENQNDKNNMTFELYIGVKK